ncbi:ApeI family dehydratase [Histophilus somni]|uniref:ApeI family dehydratase n=1 Tax=Histophilus somni TaxID=731 RepID=UPI0021CCD982|nr:hydroxymyristoyl-ACP dehydratase [Histophilus somni]
MQNPIWLSETQEENLQIFRAKVPLDLCYFKGHFANFPLVPGVVELQWVKEKIDAYFGKEMQMNRIDNLKFQKFLRPNDEFELTLKWEEGKNRMGFQLKTEGEMCASGLVIFKNG